MDQVEPENTSRQKKEAENMIALDNKIIDLSPPSIALFLPPNHQSWPDHNDSWGKLKKQAGKMDRWSTTERAMCIMYSG